MKAITISTKSVLKSMTIWGFLILAVKWFASKIGLDLPDDTVGALLDNGLNVLGGVLVLIGRLRKGDLNIGI